jgi:hypothetical protein
MTPAWPPITRPSFRLKSEASWVPCAGWAAVRRDSGPYVHSSATSGPASQSPGVRARSYRIDGRVTVTDRVHGRMLNTASGADSIHAPKCCRPRQTSWFPNGRYLSHIKLRVPR